MTHHVCGSCCVDVRQAEHDCDALDAIAALFAAGVKPRDREAALATIEAEVRRTGRLSDDPCPACAEARGGGPAS